MHAIVIGAGFSGMSTAAYLAQKGYRVTVLEKHDGPGGRGRQWQSEGYTFDMGPSWYWMPDVFDRFFEDMGKKTIDYYDLHRTDPAYRVVFGKEDFMDMPTDPEALIALFEAEEKGAGEALRKFLKKAEDNYNIAMKDLVYQPGLSPLWN